MNEEHKGYYIAPNRKGYLVKIVEDVRVPISDKLGKIAGSEREYLVRPALVARFTSEKDAKKWLEAYETVYGNQTQ